jgi:hypothetical protein
LHIFVGPYEAPYPVCVVRSSGKGYLEVPVYFIGAKLGYTVRKWKTTKWIEYTGKCRHEIQE